MKTTKLMLSALVAVAALVSCNKENHSPVETGVKSISISLENAIMTKGVSNGPVSGAVTVNNFKIFLLDSHGNDHHAYTIAQDGKGEIANTYFTVTSSFPSTINLHYVDPAVTRIAIIANAGNKSWAEVKNGYALDINLQQNPDDLVLYGEDLSLVMAEEKQHLENGDITILYNAEVTLSPTVSRFEVDGFRIGFDSNPDFSSVLVSQIVFQNYYPASDAVSGEASGTLTAHINDVENDSEVYGWFNETKEAAWYWDNCNLTLTPSSPVGKVGTNGLAYHFFAGDAVPVMVIDMVVDGTRPAYVYSKSINVIDGSTKTPLTKLEAGKVYRMSAAGVNPGTDPNGYIEIPEDIITPANHCIDITVDVVDWVVTLVQPDFQ